MGFQMFTHGELPTAPIRWEPDSRSLIRIATANAEVVNVMFVNLKSYEGVTSTSELKNKRAKSTPEARIYLTR